MSVWNSIIFPKFNQIDSETDSATKIVITKPLSITKTINNGGDSDITTQNYYNVIETGRVFQEFHFSKYHENYGIFIME